MKRIITEEDISNIIKVLNNLPILVEEPKPDPIIPNYNYIQAISPNYCMLGDTEYRSKLDFISEYGNSFRFFAYSHYSDDFKITPSANWIKGDYSNVSDSYLKHLVEFIDEANKRKLRPILSLFDDCGGSGTEKIKDADRNKLQAYIGRIVNAVRGKDIIFETINEQNNRDFNGWVNHAIKILCNYPEARVTTFENKGLSNYATHHLYNPYFLSRDIIHSNDRPNAIDKSRGGWNDAQYMTLAKECKGKGGHFEMLVRWGRSPAGKLETKEQIMNQWGNILENIKWLK